MTAFECLEAFSHDDRLWRIRAWLLERTIFVLSGDLRWALIGLGWRAVSAAAAHTRVRLARMTQRDGC